MDSTTKTLLLVGAVGAVVFLATRKRSVGAPGANPADTPPPQASTPSHGFDLGTLFDDVGKGLDLGNKISDLFD